MNVFSPAETNIFTSFIQMKVCIWQWTVLRPQEMMNENLTVSFCAVSQCPPNRELHSPTKCILKREKYNIAARGRAQMFTDESFFFLVEYSLSRSFTAPAANIELNAKQVQCLGRESNPDSLWEEIVLITELQYHAFPQTYLTPGTWAKIMWSSSDENESGKKNVVKYYWQVWLITLFRFRWIAWMSLDT